MWKRWWVKSSCSTKANSEGQVTGRFILFMLVIGREQADSGRDTLRMCPFENCVLFFNREIQFRKLGTFTFLLNPTLVFKRETSLNLNFLPPLSHCLFFIVGGFLESFIYFRAGFNQSDYITPCFKGSET